jgi:hypothetical protein
MSDSAFVASAFATRLGAGKRSKSDLLAFIPPIIANTEKMELDPALLLLRGKMIMDTSAFDVVTRDRYSNNLKLARQLSALYEAGFVETRDFQGISESGKVQIGDHVEYEILNNRTLWLNELRNSIKWWEENKQKYIKSYGVKHKMTAGQSFSINTVMDVLDLPTNPKNAKKFLNDIFSDQTDDERIVTNIALREMLRHTFCNRLLSKRFDAPVHDWENFQSFSTAHDRFTSSIENNLLADSRFFIEEIAAIDTSSLTIDQLISMLKDKNIAEFRYLIHESQFDEKARIYLDKDRLYRTLVDFDVKVSRHKSSKMLTRMVSSVVFGNTPFLDILENSGGIVKSVSEFIKASITDYERPEKSVEVDRIRKAIYILRKHVE